MKTLPISDLRAAPYNPRKITPEALRGLGVSVETFGDLSGIVWNEKFGNLVAGHQRLKALVDAGAKGWQRNGSAAWIDHPKTGERFPVRIVNWDAKRERAANVAANAQTIQGEFTDGLVQVVEGIKIDFPDLAVDLRIDVLLDDLPGSKGETTEDGQAPEPPAKPVSKLGDLWLLGDHRILCGDSTKTEDVARVMDGNRAMLMATDPPYGVAYDPEWRDAAQANRLGRGRKKIEHGDDSPVDWSAALRLGNAPVAYCWAPGGAQQYLTQTMLEDAGYDVRQQIVWVKPMAPLSRSAYHWRHEPCWYAVKKGETARWEGDRKQTTVWEAASPTHIMSGSKEDRTIHPTQKPIELFAIPIRNHTRKGDVVYEPFCGSGSQIVAAEQLGRRCFALEIDPRYVDVAVLRWQRLTGQKAVHAVTGKEFPSA